MKLAYYVHEPILQLFLEQNAELLVIPNNLTRHEYAKEVAEELVDELTTIACENGQVIDLLITQKQCVFDDYFTMPLICHIDDVPNHKWTQIFSNGMIVVEFI